MKIVDAIWAPEVNLLVIKCDCGKEFRYRSDCWTIRCKYCGYTESIVRIRERFLGDGSAI